MGSQYILFTWGGVSVLSLSHLIGNVPYSQTTEVRVGGRKVFSCYRGNYSLFHHSLASHSGTLIRLHWAKGIWIIHATVQLTPASGLYSAYRILTAWLANDELFSRAPQDKFPPQAVKKTECFVYVPGCFSEALHAWGCKSRAEVASWFTARRRA